MHRNLFAVLLLVFPALTGCTQMLAENMVAPPNHWQPRTNEVNAADGRAVKIPVGPPGATLAAWILVPAQPSRGTILFLHGILADHQQLRSIACAMRDAGYTAVMVDLRGHGQSSGDHITFGVVESRDLVQVTDWLEKHHLCGETIGVYGFSYGAATAIEYAGIDRRVSTVVALASFATLSGEATHFGHALLPVPGLFFPDAMYSEIIATAGKLAHFDPMAASPLAAITHTHAHILLMHGEFDMVIPVSDSERLHDAAPQLTELHVLPVRGHIIAPFDFLGEAAGATRKWFDAHLGSNDADGLSAFCMR